MVSRNGPLPFEKMQGVGNDFVVVAAEEWGDCDWSKAAKQVCDRRLAVGGDGLLILQPSTRADHQMRMFNPDGTEDDCGNGLRCAAYYLHKRLGLPAALTVETMSGVHRCLVQQESGSRAVVEATMPRPRLNPEEIPALATHTLVDEPIRVGERVHRVTCVNTGSTHSVLFRDEPVADAEFLHDSPMLENHPLFPCRTSVIWTRQAAEDQLHVRIWERGAGETAGCGTGACAAAVAYRLKNPSPAPVMVVSAGGALQISWTSGEEILMTGPAVCVFRGDWLPGSSDFVKQGEREPAVLSRSGAA